MLTDRNMGGPGTKRVARRKQAGFTLAELMAVVTIVGVLAVIGVALVRQHIFASRSVEAAGVIQAIRGAQERWFAETRTYFNVSSSVTAWYPMGTPDGKKWAWENPTGNDFAKWELLNPTVTGPVQFGYTTVAGGVGDTPLALSIRNAPTWEVADEPWFLIQAQGNADGDAVIARFAASSYSLELYSENDGE